MVCNLWHYEIGALGDKLFTHPLSSLLFTASHLLFLHSGVLLRSFARLLTRLLLCTWEWRISMKWSHWFKSVFTHSATMWKGNLLMWRQDSVDCDYLLSSDAWPTPLTWWQGTSESSKSRRWASLKLIPLYGFNASGQIDTRRNSKNALFLRTTKMSKEVMHIAMKNNFRCVLALLLQEF